MMVEDWSWSCRRMSGVCASRQIMQACPDRRFVASASLARVHGARRRTEREGARERALTKLCRRFRSAERALHLRASIVGHAAWFCPHRSTLPSCRSRPYCDGLENWCSHKKSVFFHHHVEHKKNAFSSGSWQWRGFAGAPPPAPPQWWRWRWRWQGSWHSPRARPRRSSSSCPRWISQVAACAAAGEYKGGLHAIMPVVVVLCMIGMHASSSCRRVCP